MTWVTGLIAFVLGIAICFLGYRLFRFWLAAAGFVAGAFAGYTLGQQLFTGDVWFVVSAVVLGLLFAGLAYFLFRVGAILTGSVLGAALTNLLLTAAGVLIATWMLIIGAAIGGVLAGIFLKPYIIIGSAFNGAYLAVTGIYAVALMKDFLQDGMYMLDGELPWYVFAGVLVLTAVGACAQFRANAGREIGDMERKQGGG